MSSLLEIEKLIVKGMVIDEHGKWVPLTEKVKKEREFISHLEKGEILFDGVWRNISQVKELIKKKLKKKNEEEIAEEETAIINIIKTPEETVSFSTETIFDLPIKKSTDEEDDFPPETKIITIEKEKNNQTDSIPLNKGEKKSEIYTANNSKKEEEFEETVLYDMEILKKKIDSEKKLPSKNYSDLENIFSPYLREKNKNQKIWIFLSIILFITVTLILLILRFY